MAICVRELKFEGETGEEYVVGLWAGAEGLSVTITEEDVCGFAVEHLSLSDARMVGRKVRRLATWAETPKGKKLIQEKFEKDAALT